MRDLSFWGRYSGTKFIRVYQVAEYLGAKVEPKSGYEEDVCIFVKKLPIDNSLKYAYEDIGDETRHYRWLRNNKHVGIIAHSLSCKEYAESQIGREVKWFPQHHCNYENKTRQRKEIKRVGVIGSLGAVHWDAEDMKRRFAEIGLEYIHEMDFLAREKVVRFYENLDIQVVYRPNWPVPFTADPLKLKNAGSYRIPTVAWPEPAYVKEFDGCFIPAMNVDELVEGAKRLKESPALYEEMAGKAWERSQQYHISITSQCYKELQDA
jgi:hypothetical protein